MIYWVMMLVCNAMLVPGLVLLAGWMMDRHPPKNVNGVIGYRTMRSMRNADTWQYAQHFCGRLWLKLGCGMMVFSAAVMLLLIRAGEQTITIVSSILLMLQLVPMVGSILLVERALERTFDDSGKRRQP